MTRGTRLERGRFLTIAVGLYGLLAVVPALFGSGGSRGSLPRDEGCLSCHEGIEAMHPEAQLSCVDCHGGDPEARTSKLAHVQLGSTVFDCIDTGGAKSGVNFILFVEILASFIENQMVIYLRGKSSSWVQFARSDLIVAGQ